MKIIHLISGGDVGGAKTHVLSLLEGLGRTQQVRLVCFTAGAFADDAMAMGIDTLVLDSGVRSSIRTLTGMIQNEHFDIVHCHGSRANMIGAILKRTIKVPIVTTVHSDYRLDYLGRPFHRLTYGTINTVALRMFDYHIGVSDAMVQLLISRGFDPQKLFSIYNGVEFPPKPARLSREEYLGSLGITFDADTVVFGIAARLNPVKDIATLIRGFAGACRTCSNIRLIIAGDGEERQMLEQLAKESCPEGSVIFAGWVRDTDSFYNAIDVNMLTSLSEGSPYALVEGARMRCATIATSVGGIPYMMESGVTGLLFTPRDVDTLTAYMVRLVQNPAFRKQLGQNFYEKAERVYSAEATVHHQLEIYRTILRQAAKAKGKAPRRDDLRGVWQGQRGRRGDLEGYFAPAPAHRPRYAHLRALAQSEIDKAHAPCGRGLCLQSLLVPSRHAPLEALYLRRRQPHSEPDEHEKPQLLSS